MNFAGIGVFVLCIAILAWGATGAVGLVLRRWAVLDHPNARSSHATPVPRGGGLGLMAALAVGWLWADPHAIPLVGLAGGLMGISFLDDVRGLSVGLRLLVQGVAVGGGLILLPDDVLVLQGVLPLVGDRMLAAVLWMWFINLYNFMDGINGLTGVETASIGIGVAVGAAGSGLVPVVGWQGLALAGASVGFLRWNWAPAKVFMGDAGSVPLGYLVGWLLLVLAGSGQGAAAVILPLYYLTDATLTVVRRALRGEKIWQPHRQHFYQKAVQAIGGRHAAVTGRIGVANAGLVALAALASWTKVTELKVTAVTGAVGIVAGLLVHLVRLSNTPSSRERASSGGKNDR
ncbi:MAG: wbpL [Rhodospirillaceae bacterium]|nr:MAG: wbpL [Rhodospirillaceae bacterium]